MRPAVACWGRRCSPGGPAPATCSRRWRRLPLLLLLVACWCQPGAAEQSLTNLLLNAVRSGSGGFLVSVSGPAAVTGDATRLAHRSYVLASAAPTPALVDAQWGVAKYLLPDAASTGGQWACS